MLETGESLLPFGLVGQELLVGGDALLVRSVAVAEPPHPEVVCSDDLVESRVDGSVRSPNHGDDLGFLMGATAASGLESDVHVAANTGVA
jgi:hypothetical protein